MIIIRGLFINSSGVSPSGPKHGQIIEEILKLKRLRFFLRHFAIGLCME